MNKSHWESVIQRISTEFRNTKVITMTNQDKGGYHKEPISELFAVRANAESRH